MKRSIHILVALVGLVPAAALAHGPNEHPADPDLHVNPDLKDCSVQFSPELTQDAFGRFVREFGSVGAYKLTTAPKPLGKWRVALGLEGISFTVEEKADAWNDTFAHPDAYHELGADKKFPKVRVGLGVTDRIDVGAFYSENPNANYGWAGLEVKYGVLGQSETTPVSLGVRGAYTKTLYVDDMDMHAFTADVATARTFGGVLTPYLGVGTDLVWARETSDAVDLQDESDVVPHVLGGAELRFRYLSIGAEAQKGALATFQMQITALF